MMNSHLKVSLTLMIALLLTSSVARAAEEGDWKRMIRMCEEARVAREGMVEAPKDSWEDVAEKMASRLEEAAWDKRAEGTPGESFLRFWLLRLQLSAGEVDKYLEGAESLASDRTVAPEIWVGIKHCVEKYEKDGESVRLEVAKGAGRLIPVSRYGRLRDHIRCEGGEILHSGVPGPVLRNTVWSQGTDRFETGDPEWTDMSVLAGDVYRWEEPVRDVWLESIYLRDLHIRNPWERKKGWFSESTADAWLRVAQLEYEISGPEVAANYLAKAMVGGTERHFRLGKRLIRRWEKSPAEPWKNRKPPRDRYELKATARGEEVYKLAQKYRESNLHPRSIRILGQLDEMVGDKKFGWPPKQALPKIRKEWMKEWIEIVEKRRDGVGFDHYVLLGQRANTREQIRNITVPPPVRESVVKELAKKLPEIIASIKKHRSQAEQEGK